MTEMNLAVVGYRGFNDYEFLDGVILQVMDEWGAPDRIVSGGARGADTLAERWADDNGVEKMIYPADWDRYGKKAGMLRNRQIVDDATHMVAFLSPQSRGTWDSIRKAQTKGIPVRVVQI
jgi:hypothetical protein